MRCRRVRLRREVSPDGKWLAYHSNISGEFQVYVRPFPNVQDGRSQISTAGGTRAAWSRNGRELFYLDRDGLLTSVAIPAAPGATFTAGHAGEDPEHESTTPARPLLGARPSRATMFRRTASGS